MLEVTICTKDGKTIKRYELVGSRPLHVGRGSVCDIQVPIMDVSREHAMLQPAGDGWVLQDMNSTHGCVVRGERVRAVAVSEGLEVRIGSARMRFSNLADRIGAELNAILEEADPNAETGEPMSETLPRLVVPPTEAAASEPEQPAKKIWPFRKAS